jgi:hypothetical protein
MKEIQTGTGSNKGNDHACIFKEYHFLELQDDNGDIVGYTAIELFDHLLDQYVQPEDVADQITELHKILEQTYDPTEEPQVYYKAVQDARQTLASLNEIINDSTLIRHGLNQFKQAQLYAALMAKQPQSQTQPQPLQDSTAATIKALTDKINRLEAASSSNNRGGGGGNRGGQKNYPSIEKVITHVLPLALYFSLSLSLSLSL